MGSRSSKQPGGGKPIRAHRASKHASAARHGSRSRKCSLLEPLELRALFSGLSVPVLNSLPSATANIYLDFDGEAATTWFVNSVPITPAFSQDADKTAFSSTELTAIQEIWSRVAEKFSPFKINVSTAIPGALQAGRDVKVIIGGDGAWSGSGQTGNAWVGSFSAAFLPRTVYVFPEHLSNSAQQVAEVASHESGHAFGLSHQSSYSGSTLTNSYNPGNSLRAPTMGNSLSSARGLWWYGQTTSSTTYQDDMAILAGSGNGFGYVTDDVGNASGSATLLSGASVSASGVISQTSDQDWFSFSTTGGLVSFTGGVAAYGAMLDLRLDLYNSSNVLVGSSDTSALGESLSATVAAGTYYIVVGSHGSYGDVGQYSLTGTIPITPAAPVADAGGSYAVSEGGTVALSGAASTGSSLTYEWDLDGDGIYGESGASASRGTETGSSPTFNAAALDGPATYTIGLRVTDGTSQTSTAFATVAIQNVAPSLTIAGGSSSAEGSSYTLTLATTDSGSDTITQWIINWGDGTSDTINGNPSSATKVYADNGTYTISATATDEDGTYSATNKTVTVTNVSPSLTVSGASTALEGGTYTLALAATDPGSDTISQWIINWGNGTSQAITGNPTSVTKVYADNGNYTISATAIDEDGTYAATPVALAVSNVAPSLTIAGASTGTEGATYTLGLSSSDPGSDALTQWIINWGNGTSQTVTGNPSSVTKVYPDNGNYTISATAIDEDGTYAPTPFALAVSNVAPSLTIAGASTGTEGATYTLGLSSSDPGSDALTQWIINWGNGTSQTVTGNPSSVTKVYADNGNYTITATATDEDGTYSANTKAINVSNAAPSLTLSGASSAAEGSSYTLSLTATDVGSDTIAQWSINWGDGTSQTITGSPSSVTKVYSDNGSYTITATATDEDGTYSANSKTVGVTDVSPSLTISGPSTIPVADTYTLALQSSDPGTDTIAQWLINWGDGSSETFTGTPANVTHAYANAFSNIAISATATNEDGTFSANTVSIDVTSEDGDTTVPTAVIGTAAKILSANGTSYTFSIVFTDDTAINVSTLGSDILVTGPNGFSQVAQLVSISPASGESVTATYSITAPGGTWESTDNGTYSLSLQPNAVADSSGNFALSAAIGSFDVLALPPDTVGNVLTSAMDIGGVAPGIVRARVDSVSAQDRNDYFKFTVVTRSKINVKLYMLTDDAALMLLDHNGNQLVYSNRSGTNHEAFAKLLAPGTYYFRVFYKGAAGTNYRLRFEATSATVPVTEFSGASPLGSVQGTAAKLVNGLVNTTAPTKYYSFVVTSTQSVYAKLYNLTDNADLAVIDSTGTILQTSNNTDLGMEGITLSLAPGTYYLQITLAAPSSAAYRLRLAQA